MSFELKSVKCPDAKLALKNCILLNPKQGVKQTDLIRCSFDRHSSLHGVILSDKVAMGEMGMSLIQRQWMNIPLDQRLQVSVETLTVAHEFVSSVVLKVEFLSKNKTSQEGQNSETMAAHFCQHHINQPIQTGQKIGFQVPDSKCPTLILTIDKISTVNPTDSSKSKEDAQFGIIFPNTEAKFQPAEGSGVMLKGRSVGMNIAPTIINPDWDFAQMGIGGLGREFNDIFRRAFVSRLFPTNIIADLGIKHAKGILLYGPPGTGKTLMARQIGKMLNSRKPKIVNGPEILSKMVGDSEANVRALFAEAEKEEKLMGPNSGLHMIIFDEIDAICKQRGSSSSGVAVHDTVVNQLLSKIDGVEQLNNVLIIGMTNRKDLIDDALLRPGRLEVQMEISLADEKGRVEIFNIHTANMRESGRLGDDVNIQELAEKTKNFSGAEIEGLVRAAQSTSLNSYIKATSKVEINPAVFESLKINRAHFMHALEHDIQPAFGADLENLNDYLLYGIKPWSSGIEKILRDGSLYAKQTSNSDRTALVTVLIEGERFTGKTALATKIAIDSDFPFTKIIHPGKLVECNDSGKIRAIYRIFADAHKSELSCIILDNIESLIEYVPIGPRFSSTVLQVIATLLQDMPPRGHKLMIIATTSQGDVLDAMGMRQLFTKTMRVPKITQFSEFETVVEDLEVFTPEEIALLKEKIGGQRISVGVKKLIDLCMTARQVSNPAEKIATFIELMISGGGLQFTNLD